MKKTGALSTFKFNKSFALLFSFLVLFSLPLKSAFAYKEGSITNGVLIPSTHQWIIDRAIELLESNNRGGIKRYPFKSYIPLIHWGAWYADNTDVKCIWKGFREESCDSIHHYSKIGDIVAWKSYSPHTTVANTGDFSATLYSQILFDQAVRFWPGGLNPKLTDLPYKYAGSIQASLIITGVTDLGNTYLGGQPFCEKQAYLEKASSVISVNECPKWPKWAAADQDLKIAKEDSDTSMRYLGWAIHMIEDLTVPYHANNQATSHHTAYESDIQKPIENQLFDHLPIVISGVDYKYKPCGECKEGLFYFPIVEKYEQTTLSIEQLAQIASQIATTTDNGDAILPNAKKYWNNYDIISRKAIMERGLDAAIKLVASVLEKYLIAISLDVDTFEPNDHFADAASLDSGYHTKLTIDAPNDNDWYKISIPADFSDMVIDLYYDRSEVELASRVVHKTDFFAGVPFATFYGKRIEMSSLKKGDYYLQTYSPNQNTVAYEIHVVKKIGTGSLPFDRFEDNDSPAQASKFYNGCDFTGTLTIDQPGDDDYYYIDSAIGIRISSKVLIDANVNVQMFLNGKLASQNIEKDNTKRLEISLCTTGVKPLVRISGQTTNYSMCILSKVDPNCMPNLSSVSEVSLKNLRLFSDWSPDELIDETRRSLKAVSLPDLSGKWKSNLGFSYSVVQKGKEFSWSSSDAHYQNGIGSVAGTKLNVSWTGLSGSGLLEGVILDMLPNGKAMLVQWNNGVVFFR